MFALAGIGAFGLLGGRGAAMTGPIPRDGVPSATRAMTGTNGRERGDAESQAQHAQMFQGIQGGRPPAERGGEQLRRRTAAAAGAAASRPWCPRRSSRSYYGRPVLKPPVWKDEIPAYLFTGGLAAGSRGAGGGRGPHGPARRCAARPGRIARPRWSPARASWSRDLGRPERFHHMLRVAKPTSPMSVGTWILTALRARGRGSPR